MIIYAGIDVSKDYFDVGIHGRAEVWHFDYVQEQIAECIKRLTESQVALTVLEATGGYEIELAIALQS